LSQADGGGAEAAEKSASEGAEDAGDSSKTDAVREAVLETLTTQLDGAVVGAEISKGDLWVRVRPEAWKKAAEICRRSLDFDYFCFLSGIDWMPHTWPNPKVEGESSDAAEAEEPAETQAPAPVPGAQVDSTEADAVPTPEPAAVPGDEKRQTGVAGGDTRFQVLARLYSTTRHVGITLKADLDDENPRVASIAEVYPGADWHERETWEMYGLDFVGHPDQRHLYLPSEFEGFPLRKDFPLLSREVKPWPGLVDVEPMPPGTDDAETATGDTVEAGGASADEPGEA